MAWSSSQPVRSHLTPWQLEVGKLVGGDLLYFHDAIAPIVEADSIDMNKA